MIGEFFGAMPYSHHGKNAPQMNSGLPCGFSPLGTVGQGGLETECAKAKNQSAHDALLYIRFKSKIAPLLRTLGRNKKRQMCIITYTHWRVTSHGCPEFQEMLEKLEA